MTIHAIEILTIPTGEGTLYGANCDCGWKQGASAHRAEVEAAARQHVQDVQDEILGAEPDEDD